MEKTFYYARVSTREQNLSRQIAAFHELGADDHDIFIDKASGKDLNREQYQIMRGRMRAGDTLVIKSLDRLGRNKADILEEMRYFKTGGIRVKIMDLPTTMINAPEGSDAIIEMVTNILIEVLATFAEQEREHIRQRQREGIDAMKHDEKGRKLSTRTGNAYGRPAVQLPSGWDPVIEEWRSGKITAVEAFTRLHLTKSSFYNLVRRNNVQKEA